MKLAKLLLEEIITPDNSLGITRDEMPQIDSKDFKAFLKYLDKEGCEHEECSVPASELKPSQNELDTEKADKIWNDGGVEGNPIFISQDNFILDGHHRWLAVNRNDKDAEMKCLMIKKEAKECLEIMNGFSKTKNRDIEDNLVEGMKLAKAIIMEAKRIKGTLYVTKEEKEVAQELVMQTFDRGYANIDTELKHKVAMDLVKAGQAVITKKKEYGKIAQIRGVD